MMNTDLIWPSISRVAEAGSQESVSCGFEAELIRQLWDEQRGRIFCEDESDMLVECGMISETGVDTAELESDGDLEAFIESRERAGEEDQVQDNQLSNLEEQKIMPKIQTHKQSTFFFHQSRLRMGYHLYHFIIHAETPLSLRRLHSLLQISSRFWHEDFCAGRRLWGVRLLYQRRE